MVTVGVIAGEVFEETKVPPQELSYQYQFAPVPKDPPVKLIVEDVPEQIVAGVIETEEGCTDKLLTVTVVLTHAVELQYPAALT